MHPLSPVPAGEAGAGPAPAFEPPHAASPEPGAVRPPASLPDGTHTVDELLGALLLRGFGMEEIEEAFRALHAPERAGEPAPPAGGLPAEDRERYAEQIRFLAWVKNPHGTRLELGAQLAEGVRAQARLRDATVRVLGQGRASDRLLELLHAAGVGHPVRASSPDGDAGEGGTLTDGVLNVYCPDRFDEAFAEALNRASIRAGVPVVFYRSRGAEVECGPLVIPRSTACYRCLATRRLALLSPLERVWVQRAEANGSLAFPLGIEFLALEIVRFLTRVDEPVVQGRLWRFSLQTGEARVHPVLRLPRCGECSAGEEERPPVKIWADHA